MLTIKIDEPADAAGALAQAAAECRGLAVMSDDGKTYAAWAALAAIFEKAVRAAERL